jgi:hypothetical protein
METTVCACIVIVVLSIASGMLYSTLVYWHPDFSQAKFEPGDMIVLKVGGIGQVITRHGERRGAPGYPTYVFRYEVRQNTQHGTLTQTYQEWELEIP